MSGGNKLSKLHHYVPQAYLRGFGNDKSRIAVAPLDSSRKRFVSSARNIAAKKHFHTINELDEPDAFEKALSAVESEASKIIQSMLEDDFSLTEQDRWRFSYYMALQSVRGPDTRASIEHIAAEMTRIEIGAGGRKNVGRWIKDKIGVDASEADEEMSEPEVKANIRHLPEQGFLSRNILSISWRQLKNW